MRCWPVPHGNGWAVQAENGEMDGVSVESRFFVFVWSSHKLASLFCDDFERRLRGRY
jgi:hypothetical protein